MVHPFCLRPEQVSVSIFDDEIDFEDDDDSGGGTPRGSGVAGKCTEQEQRLSIFRAQRARRASLNDEERMDELQRRSQRSPVGSCANRRISAFCFAVETFCTP